MKGRLPALVLALLGVLLVPSWPVQLAGLLYVVVVTLAYGYARVLRSALQAERSAAEVRGWAGSSLDLRFRVTNSSALPATAVLVFDRPGDLRVASTPAAAIHLPPRTSREIGYELLAEGRGVHLVGPLQVRASDPLGLFPFDRTVDSRCRVVVYPRIVRLSQRIQGGLPGGQLRATAPQHEDVHRFVAIRSYLPGDDLRRIHWKVSARRGSLHTLEYERTLECPGMVLLDFCSSHYPLRHRHDLMERAVEVAASLVALAASRRQRLGFYTTGLVDGVQPAVPPASGRTSLPYFLELLARIAPSDADVDLLAACVGAGLPLPAGALLSVVSPPGLDVTELRGMLRGIARAEVYEVGGSEADRRRPMPSGVRLRHIALSGEEIADG